MKIKFSIHLLFFISVLILSGCSSIKKSTQQTQTPSPFAQFGNFDKVFIPNNAPLISHMISIVQPEIEESSRNTIANNIQKAITKYKIEPQIIIALIDTESNFKYDKVSTTGDLSLAQVNVDVWNVEFKRMKMPLINKVKLVSIDQSYAMEVMAKILSILKKRYSKHDRRWYARYHSNTTKYKLNYLKQIEIRMKMLSKANVHKLNTIALNTPKRLPR